MSAAAAGPVAARWTEKADACMADLRTIFPRWLKQSPPACEGVAQCIRFVAEHLAGRFTPAAGTEETQRRVKEALETTQYLRAQLVDLFFEDPILMIGDCSTTELADQRKRTFEAIQKEEMRAAYRIGLVPPRALAALAGLEQKLQEVQSLAPKGPGRPTIHLAVGLETDIYEELDRWRQRGLVGFSRAEQEAVLDLVFIHLQIHFPEHGPHLQRAHKKTIGRHRKRHQADRARLETWSRQNRNE